MAKYTYRGTYKRRLPHIHPLKSIFFVTFRLAGSFPKAKLLKHLRKKALHTERLRRFEKTVRNPEETERARAELLRFERAWFVEFEEILDKAVFGPKWLSVAAVRDIVAAEIAKGDGEDYKLYAFCIMSNHVHLVLKPLLSEADLQERSREGIPVQSERKTLTEILRTVKGASARKANLALGRSGRFWAPESYDRFVRSDDELYRTIRYTIRNPVKAGLTESWKDWKGTYLKDEYRDWFE